MNIHSTNKRQIGLIFGKFYPLHCGHVYLIEKAISQVDELHIILGCEQNRDLILFQKSHMPKQPQVKDRLYWLQETFKNRPNIHIHILDEAGIAYYPDGWKDWSDRVKSILQKNQITPTIIFTSELQDAKNHQLYYNCDVKLIDVNRQFINISATKIRDNPYQNWQFIAKAAKPFFTKRIAIIGERQFDTLPRQLANIYNTQYVSNGYINYIQHQHLHNNKLVLNESDYIRIALLHAKRLDEATPLANQVIFTSLDFQTLHHFYQQAFKRSSKILKKLEDNYHFDQIIDANSFNKSDSSLTIFEAAIDMINKQLS
ncbi:multifunctional transcriptional regulator/nicotinamide-nucleotide adenylyltransferase/ribosylnicotinamide kinase NadR [Orbus sturtevantii]|uniref:multifunctional transcriptional regulator/nicotinamide-nucleotide adenylyltransferase/ribosylnicotinamide kinase NadR n=1 Tax=Orbus sturtevantii TaxID=3074109 RepID=UPI00370DDC57